MDNLVWIVAVISLLCIEGSVLKDRKDIVDELLSTTSKDSTIQKKDEVADVIQKRKIIEDLVHLFDIDSDIALEESKRSEEERVASVEDQGPSSQALHGKKRDIKRNKLVAKKYASEVIENKKETEDELYNEALNLLEEYNTRK